MDGNWLGNITPQCSPPTASNMILSHFLLAAKLYPLLHSKPISMPLYQCHSLDPEDGGSNIP